MSLIKGVLENSKIQGLIAFKHEVEAKMEPIERTIVVLDEVGDETITSNHYFLDRYIVMDDMTKEIGIIYKTSLAGMKIIG